MKIEIPDLPDIFDERAINEATRVSKMASTKKGTPSPRKGRALPPEVIEKIKTSVRAKTRVRANDHGAKISEGLKKNFEKRLAAGLGGGTRSKACTVDGITVYPTRTALIAALGAGTKGWRHPNFRYIDTNKSE